MSFLALDPPPIPSDNMENNPNNTPLVSRPTVLLRYTQSVHSVSVSSGNVHGGCWGHAHTRTHHA
jgi:hypothetical protein